jgi:phosphatidylserine decarboxylase
MTIHKEGYKTLGLIATIVAVTVLFEQMIWPQLDALHVATAVIGGIFFLIVLQFFRSPKRKILITENGILCPADGRVVVIEETEETEYFKEKRLQVSIFMSPLNVHINRYPLTGSVTYTKYHPGNNMVAWHPKSSSLNEHNTVVIKKESGEVEILMRQIAGFVARRIIWYCKPNDSVEQGKELGFIKFGSRVDLFLPLDSDVKVEIGQKVKGGKTIIAELAR